MTTLHRSQRRRAVLAATSLVTAVALLPFASTIAPAGVIHDPALVLSLLMLLVAGATGLRMARSAGKRSEASNRS